jgi:hypothetical protein
LRGQGDPGHRNQRGGTETEDASYGERSARRTGFARIGLRDSVPLEVQHDGEQRDGEQDELRAQHAPPLTRDKHDGRRYEHAPEQDHRLGGAVDERPNR